MQRARFRYCLQNALLLGGFMVTSTVYVATTGVLTNYKRSGKLYEQMKHDIKNYDEHKDVIDTLQATVSSNINRKLPTND